MADFPVRRGNSPGGALSQNDPFQMVRESMRRMQDLFRDPRFELDPIGFFESGRMTQFAPAFEVRETQNGLVFQADLPGVKEDDVDVTVVGNRLRISGKREFDQETRGDTWYAAERSYGSFTRTFLLPEGCDTNDVDADFENGVLTVRLAKRTETQPRRISLGGRRAVEGQYSQGPFHQSQTSGQQNVGTPQGATGQSVNVGGQGAGQGAGQNVGGQGVGGRQGYGGMYGQTPEAGQSSYGGAAASAGFEHGEQAGGGEVGGSTTRVGAENAQGFGSRGSQGFGTEGFESEGAEAAKPAMDRDLDKDRDKG